MTALETLLELRNRGVVLEADGDQLHYTAPTGMLTEDLTQEVKENRSDIISILRDRKIGDGKIPPLDRPPQTRQELERLIDYTDDLDNFLRWFEWAMNYCDPSEA